MIFYISTVCFPIQKSWYVLKSQSLLMLLENKIGARKIIITVLCVISITSGLVLILISLPDLSLEQVWKYGKGVSVYKQCVDEKYNCSVQ